MVVIEMNPRVSRSSALASQGDRLPDRQDRGQARGRLHARRDPQRHHALDAVVLRADARLRRGEDPALGVREVPGDEPGPGHADEVGGRGHGDRAHLQGGAAEGASARWRSAAPAWRADGKDRIDPGAPAREADHAQLGAHLLHPLRAASRACRWTRSRSSRASIPGSSRQIEEIVEVEGRLRSFDLRERPAGRCCAGPSASASPTASSPTCTGAREDDVRARRKARRASRPVFKRVDTCAAEFAAETPVPVLDLRGRVTRPSRPRGAR